MPDTPQDTPEKQDRIGIRIDHDLAETMRAKAAQRGWSLSAVVRGLLIRWAKDDGDVLHMDDVGAASTRAPRKPNKRKRKPKK